MQIDGSEARTNGHESTEGVPASWQPRATAPRDGTPCLFVRRDGKMTVDWWDKECSDRFWKEYGGEYLYTHWMPLPEQPK
ncbi:DUF551 domain-containing protein [Bradyrhizobium tunisiense]|uniref:DUF551 domain-containing protein n=1 Tax=Bradyrhizobium tunisiense TaxID=3278709 RepID=UPI0035E1E340